MPGKTKRDRTLEVPENLEFVAHNEGHVFDLPSMLSFFEKHLNRVEDRR